MSLDDKILADAARSRGWTVVNDKAMRPCPRIHNCGDTAYSPCSKIEFHTMSTSRRLRRKAKKRERS